MIKRFFSNFMLFIMGVIFFGAGIFASYLAYFQPKEQLKWPTIEAVVITQKPLQDLDVMIDDAGDVTPKLSYAYEVNGTRYVSDNWGDAIQNYSEDARLFNENYKPNAKIKCYYNPNDHEYAKIYIKEHSAWILCFTLLFSVVGGGLLIYFFRIVAGKVDPNKATETYDEYDEEEEYEEDATDAINENPITSAIGKIKINGRSVNSLGALIGMSVFVLIFPTVYIIFFIYPFFSAKQYDSWIQTPCTILESKVIHSGSGKNQSSKAQINYRYEVDSKSYGSGNVAVSHMNSSGYVHQYPKGATRHCYYNPENPQDAILVREYHFDSSMVLFGLFFCGIPLVILVIGVFQYCNRNKKNSSRKGKKKNVSPTGQKIANMMMNVVNSAELLSKDDTVQKVAHHAKHAFSLIKVITSILPLIFVGLFLLGMLSAVLPDNIGEYFYEPIQGKITKVEDEVNATISYEVDSEIYTIVWRNRCLDEQEIEVFQKQYPVGTIKQIFYDVSSPERATIEKPKTQRLIIALIIIAIWIGILVRVIFIICKTINETRAPVPESKKLDGDEYRKY